MQDSRPTIPERPKASYRSKLRKKDILHEVIIQPYYILPRALMQPVSIGLSTKMTLRYPGELTNIDKFSKSPMI